MRFVSSGQRKAVAAALKPIYEAADAVTAKAALQAFADPALRKANPHTVAAFDNAWERFTPFLAFPPEIRRVIYTTNAIESLNLQLRKVTKNRGRFPNDAAVVKLLWLAICTIEDKRALEREKERGKPAGERKAPPRLVEGAVTTSWEKALSQLAIAFPELINPYLRTPPDDARSHKHLTGSRSDTLPQGLRADAARRKAARAGAAASRGYVFLHHAVDDFSRLACSEELPDERKETAAEFWGGPAHSLPSMASP